MPFRLVPWLLAILALSLSTALADAHGKKINVEVTASTPDAKKPLARLYRALLTFDDGDKVNDAKLTLAAQRAGRSESVGPVAFAREGGEGVYQARVTYPAYGQWNLRFRVTEPGEGEATLTEWLSPPSPEQTDATSARIIVPLAFDAKDALNVAARLTHTFAAAAWFGLSLMLFAGPRLVAREAWAEALARLAARLPLLLGAVWLLLIISGGYLATNNVPSRAPGVLAPDVLLRLPWGREYLLAFALKMAMVAGVIASGAGIGYALRRTSEETGKRVTRLAALNLLLGFIIFADVVVIGYLHNLSHLGLLK